MSEKTSKESPSAQRVYTRTGDRGTTGLFGGYRVPKYDLRIEAYGTVDELNAFVGLALVSLDKQAGKYAELTGLSHILKRIQHELFNLGSILATKPENVRAEQPTITEVEVSKLEQEMYTASLHIPPLQTFVLPRGSRLNAELHICRTVCRRAERLLVSLAQKEQVPSEAIRYLNRLSDAFFVWSRWANHKLGAPEVLWEPNQAASASRS